MGWKYNAVYLIYELMSCHKENVKSMKTANSLHWKPMFHLRRKKKQEGRRKFWNNLHFLAPGLQAYCSATKIYQYNKVDQKIENNGAWNWAEISIFLGQLGQRNYWIMLPFIPFQSFEVSFIFFYFSIYKKLSCFPNYFGL